MISAPVRIPVRLIDQRYEGVEVTIIIFDLGRSDLAHSGLTLTTSNTNFHRDTTLEGSVDQEVWVDLPASHLIYDDPLESPSRNVTITYPAITDRYLRLKIYDRTERPLIISGALAERATSTAVAEIATSTIATSSVELVDPAPSGSFFFNEPLLLLVVVATLVTGVIGGLAFRLFKQTQV